jgi:rSAM/selenodomain-associated transferase 1
LNGEAHRCALAVMAKAPVSGAVKSRLVPPLTRDEAAALNRCFIRDVCASIEGAVAMIPPHPKVSVSGVIAYTPAGAEAAFEGLVPASFEFIEQRGEGFGGRLINAAGDLLSKGFDSVALMNSDSPTIPSSIIADAVTSLARPGDRVAIVGADDGGYCLIGLKQRHARVFEEIAWSTDAVFAQTLERIGELGLEIARLPSWYDVDDAAALRRLVAELFAHQSRGDKAGSSGMPSRSQSVTTRSSAQATRAWLIDSLANGLAIRLGIADDNAHR